MWKWVTTQPRGQRWVIGCDVPCGECIGTVGGGERGGEGLVGVGSVCNAGAPCFIGRLRHLVVVNVGRCARGASVDSSAFSIGPRQHFSANAARLNNTRICHKRTVNSYRQRAALYYYYYYCSTALLDQPLSSATQKQKRERRMMGSLCVCQRSVPSYGS